MRRDELLLAEMIEAAEQAIALTAGTTTEDIQADRQRRDALLWNVTVLGEAASQVSEQTRAAFPEVEWRQPARLRNRIVHGYWSIDLDILHTTAVERLPAFLDALRHVLAALEESDDE
ncbi:MAG: HepT-like ribonuclease domain-containing protein [Pseudonocardiaceae bacterium]